jgi:hypothetical protein
MEVIGKAAFHHQQKYLISLFFQGNLELNMGIKIAGTMMIFLHILGRVKKEICSLLKET